MVFFAERSEKKRDAKPSSRCQVPTSPMVTLWLLLDRHALTTYTIKADAER